MVWLAATAFLLIGYALLILYYYRHFKNLPLFSVADYQPETFVSVIVAARNEEKTLPHLVAALAVQTYPQHLFEVIIVDDFSTDATAAAVQTLPFDKLRVNSAQDKLFSKLHIEIIRPGVAPAQSSKKRALEAGIEKAKGPLLLITDADCIPGRDWIKTMAAFHEQKDAAFIAAPVKFTCDGSLLHRFQALDFLTLQGITAASVAAQFHAMCNGANLAYTKKAFEAAKGFEGIDHIASGDDMLLMYKIWKQQKNRVHYLKSPDAIVSTAPMPSWKAFFNQRRRWVSKTTHYKDKRVFFVLLFVYLFNCWFLILLTATFWNAHIWKIAAGYLFFKTVIEWPFVKMTAGFYGEKKWLRFFPFFQPLHAFYTISVGAISQLGAYEWKGRRTK